MGGQDIECTENWKSLVWNFLGHLDSWKDESPSTASRQALNSVASKFLVLSSLLVLSKAVAFVTSRVNQALRCLRGAVLQHTAVSSDKHAEMPADPTIENCEPIESLSSPSGPHHNLSVTRNASQDTPDCTHIACSQHEQERVREAITLLLRHTNPHSKSRAAPTLLCNCPQRDTWDCGVACLQIISTWLHEECGVDASTDESTERQHMLEFLGTQSIWTIELILLLDRMLTDMQEASQVDKRSASFLLCSKTLGVDVAHRRLGYYERTFKDDMARVQKCFELARLAELPMLTISRLTWECVVELVSRRDCVAIMLLDGATLRDESKPYAGHYVIASGISYDPSCVQKAIGWREHLTDYCVVIKNPGSPNETDYVSPAWLEKAWRATGTDDDIILIAKHQTA